VIARFLIVFENKKENMHVHSIKTQVKLAVKNTCPHTHPYDCVNTNFIWTFIFSSSQI
jgi:hypothetical protein